MASLNKVCLIGNLGADPEVRSFSSGGKVCNLRIATSETWKDKATGERREKSEWHTVAIFSEGLAGVAERFLKKGSKVYIEGKLATRKWQDKDCSDRYSTEVVLNGPTAVLTMLDGAQGAGGADQWSANNRQAGSQSSARGASGGGFSGQPAGGGYDDLDSDIPF